MIPISSEHLDPMSKGQGFVDVAGDIGDEGSGNRGKMERCKHCRRLKLGHPKPFGEKECKLEPIEKEDELKKDDEEKLKNEARKRSRSTDT